jgi:hypothetical protein
VLHFALELRTSWAGSALTHPPMTVSAYMGGAGGIWSTTRDELAALRDAIDMVLTWPDAVRTEVARWLAPEAAKGNGVDPRPPAAPTKEAKVRQAKVRRPNAFSAKTAERKLIAAMADNPGMTVIALANSSNASRSPTGERLRQLAERGVVEKSASGRWRLRDDPPDPPPAGEASRPTAAPSS